MCEKREFDLVLFGATGFVGYYAARELIQSLDSSPTEYVTLKWAVAGRNVDKLEQVLLRIGKELNKDLSEIMKIHADVQDVDSLLSMAKRTKVLLNLVGPYLLYGQPVVKACVQAGTHQLDISAEIQSIEKLQLDYHVKAKQNDCLIVSACGWASVFTELAVDYIKKHFDGTLHSVETFVDLKVGKKGYTVHYGTFHSILYLFVQANSVLPSLRQRLFGEVLPAKIPKSRIRLRRWLYKFPSSDTKLLQVMFPGPDRAVHRRTQYYNYEHFHERPVQMQTYYRLRYWRATFGVPLIGLFYWCKPGRALLKRNVELLSCGFISKKGPTREQIDSTRFSLRINAQGWKEKCDKPDQEPKGRLNKKLKMKISGGDPAYLVTAMCLVQAGLTLLKDAEQMPSGGVLTPGSAFRDTKLWQRLQNRGIVVQIDSKQLVETKSTDL